MKKIFILLPLLLISMVLALGQITETSITLTGSYGQIGFKPIGQPNTYSFGTKQQENRAMGLYGSVEGWLAYWEVGTGNLILNKGSVSIINGDLKIPNQKYIGYTYTPNNTYLLRFRRTGIKTLSGGTNMPIDESLTIESDGLISFLETDADKVCGWMDVNNNNFIWSGRIGIGTTVPHNKLEIGTGYSFHDGGHKVIGFGYAAGGSGTVLQNGYISEIRFDPVNGIFTIGTSGASYSAGQNASPSKRFYILANGDIGIGTSTPDYKLDVAGTVRAKEVIVEEFTASNGSFDGSLAVNNITVKANGNTADFVFSDTYNLKNLTEVESFIKTNKHLEGIPSAEIMEAQGVNLAEMNKLLLQKVEELTLYTIEKDKEVKELKASKEQQEQKSLKLEERLAKLEALLLQSAPNLQK